MINKKEKTEKYITRKLKGMINEVKSKEEFYETGSFIVDEDIEELCSLSKKHIIACNSLEEPEYEFLSNNYIRGLVSLYYYFRGSKNPLNDGKTAQVIVNICKIRDQMREMRKDIKTEIRTISLPRRI